MKKVLEKLVNYWYVWAMLFIACCILVVLSVLNDWDTLLGFSYGGCLLSILMMLLSILLALCLRKWRYAVVALLGLVGSLVLGMLTGIMIGAGQHHAPKHEEPLVDIYVCNLTADGDGNQVLSNEIEKNSWWTDGMNFYQVVRTGSTIRMEGGTLHEGGSVLELAVTNDTLRVKGGDDDYTPFAFGGALITHNQISDPDSTMQRELLIAYGDGQKPIAVLERFDGDELTYELAQLRAVLAGKYHEGSDQWQFLPDGTVLMPGQQAPKRYNFELSMHMPTNIIRLPDGSRYGAMVTEGHELILYRATYNKDEEWWEFTDTVDKRLACDGETVDWTDGSMLYSDAVNAVSRYEYLSEMTTQLCSNPLGWLNDCLVNETLQRIREADNEQEE